MKKFLRICVRHPVSVTGMIIATVIAIQERNVYPIIILIIPCGLLYVIWELGFLSYRFEKDFWRNIVRKELERRKESEK